MFHLFSSVSRLQDLVRICGKAEQILLGFSAPSSHCTGQVKNPAWHCLHVACWDSKWLYLWAKLNMDLKRQYLLIFKWLQIRIKKTTRSQKVVSNFCWWHPLGHGSKRSSCVPFSSELRKDEVVHWVAVQTYDIFKIKTKSIFPSSLSYQVIDHPPMFKTEKVNSSELVRGFHL